jgi:hypothetical protein
MLDILFFVLNIALARTACEVEYEIAAISWIAVFQNLRMLIFQKKLRGGDCAAREFPVAFTVL